MSREKKLTEQTFLGFLWMITGSGIQVVLKIVVIAVLARLITPKEFGVMGIAVIVLEFSKLFTQMGVGPAIIQRKELERRHLEVGFTLSLLMGLFFSSLLVLIAPLLAAFFRMEGLVPIMRVISLVFLVDSFTLIGQALMQRNMKFKVITTIEVLSYTIGYGAVGIVLGYFGWGVWALVIANLSQAVLQAVLIVWVQPFSKRLGTDFKTFKELLHFGGGMTIARIGNYLALQGDNLVVGRILGEQALGIYGRAYQFMAMPAGLFGNALDKTLFPAMAKVQDDKQKLGKAYLTSVSIIALIAIPLSILLVVLAPETIMTLLGSNWKDVILPFQILACSLLFRMSYKMSDSLTRAMGAVYRRAWRQFIFAALVIIGAYVGHFWSLSGVAWGVAVALVVNFLLMAQLSIQLVDITWLSILKAHWHGLILGATTGIVSYIIVKVCRFYIQSHALTLLISIVSISFLLFLVIWYFPRVFIRDDHNKLFNKLISKRFKKLPIQTA